MNELKEIILYHLSKYPLMEVQDAVKLIYQNEFGPGHLLSDAERALSYLTEEIKSLEDYHEDSAVSIGNGLIRADIRGLSQKKRIQLINSMKTTAENINGSTSVFEDKLNVLVELKREGYFSFTLEELNHYLKEYKKKGYPMVSHSEKYRALYHPHYRVIKK